MTKRTIAAARSVAVAALLLAGPAMAGDIEAEAQRLLNGLGYYVGTVDGVWGGKSRKALAAFQQDAGLPRGEEIDLAALQSALTAFHETYSPLTSHDRQRGYLCRFNDNPALLESLTLPHRKGRIPYRDAEGDGAPNEKPMLAANAFADLAGDGTLDNLTFISGLYVPRRITPVFVYRDGAPTLPPHITQYGVSADYGFRAKGKEITKIAIDDFNRDGIDDAIFADYGEHDYKTYGHLMGGGISIALSKSDGTYDYTTLTAPVNAYHGGVTLDIDLDGDPDFVGVGPPVKRTLEDDFVVVMENDGTGKLNYSPELSLKETNTWKVSAEDIDGDGITDLLLGISHNVAYNPNGPQLKIYWGGRQRSVPTVVKIKQGYGALGIESADLDGDGDKDILFVAEGNERSGIDTAEHNTLITLVTMDGRQPVAQHTFGRNNTGATEVVVCDGKVLQYFSLISKIVEIRPGDL